MPPYRRTAEKLVYRNHWVELFDDAVETPSGQPGTFTRLRYRDNVPGVVIVPRLPDQRLLLITSHRYAIGEHALEFPRGSAEPGETPTEAALRELREETSLVPTRTALLGVQWPDSSILETRVHIFLAEIPSLDALLLDAAVEGIDGHTVLSLDELRQAVAAGEIHDGFTLSALALLLTSPEAR